MDRYREVRSELLWGSPHPVKHPFFTILILTYRRPQLFREALLSALAQKEACQAWEILVLDNNPQETEVLKIIDAIGDRRVRYYRNTRNIGHEGSMNRGIGMADGDWVVLLHDDDLLRQNCLQYLSRYLKICSGWKKPLAYIRAGHQCFQSTGEIRQYAGHDRMEACWSVKPELWLDTLLRGFGPTSVNSCGSAVRRSAFLEVGGYNEALHPIADATLGLLLMEHGYSVYVSECVLGFYRQGKNVSAEKETMLSLIKADQELREYLYSRNLAARIFGFCFRGVQYQTAVDVKLAMAEKYHGKQAGTILSAEEINQVYPYKKHILSKAVLKILQNMADLCYRHRRPARIAAQIREACGKGRKKRGNKKSHGRSQRKLEK